MEFKRSFRKTSKTKIQTVFVKILTKQFQITAMMDITDGLVQDTKKLAIIQASDLKLEINIDKIPQY